MRSKEPVEGTDIVWSCQPLIHDNERLSGKVASLTLALQAAHKGLHRLSKQNKKLKEDINYLRKTTPNAIQEQTRRVAIEKTVYYLHKRIAELESGIVIPKVKVFQDDHLAN